MEKEENYRKLLLTSYKQSKECEGCDDKSKIKCCCLPLFGEQVKLTPLFVFTVHDKEVPNYSVIKIKNRCFRCCCCHSFAWSKFYSAWIFTFVFLALVSWYTYNLVMDIGKYSNVISEFQPYQPWTERSTDFCARFLRGGPIYKRKGGKYQFKAKEARCDGHKDIS
jgi:hypothetical protein